MQTSPRDISSLRFVGFDDEDLALDTVRASTVDALVDKVLMTLTHYSATSRLHVKGVTSDEVADWYFPQSMGTRSYPREVVMNFQTAAHHALRAFEIHDSRTAAYYMDDVVEYVMALREPHGPKLSLLVSH